MAKEEKPLEYQRRIRDTKGVAQRLDLDYLKRTSLLLLMRKRATWILVAATALASVPLVVGLAGSHRSLSSGPLSASHAVFEGRCEVCHTQPFAQVKNEACEGCHDGAAHPAKPMDTAKSNVTPRCAECHMEHRGQTRLGLVASGDCTRCHADLNAHATGVKIKAVEISAFREGKHPEFSTAALKDERPFQLNHKKHMPAEPKKIRGIDLPMKCVDCHKTDLSSPTGNLIPMTFEASCKRCHKPELQFDIYQVLGESAQESPHTRDQTTIRQFIEKSYREALAANPSLPKNGLGMDQVVLTNPEAWLAKVSNDSYEYLFGKKCPYCHQMESQYEVKKIDPRPPQSPTAPVQAPLGILGRYPEGQPWLTRAEFSHRSHREVECESCHTAARTSEKTEDVLIPVMKTCLPCHGESRADLDRCSECHLYHNRSQEKERERRPTEKIIGQIPGSPSVTPTVRPSVGRTPWSARVPLDPLLATAQDLARTRKADEGVGRGPGGPPHDLVVSQFDPSQGGPQ